MRRQVGMQLLRAGRNRHAYQAISGRKLVHDFVTQWCFGTHQPMFLVSRRLPIEQEGRREVGAVENGQGIVGYRLHECRGEAKFTGTIIAEAGGTNQVRIGAHQADSA